MTLARLIGTVVASLVYGAFGAGVAAAVHLTLTEVGFVGACATGLTPIILFLLQRNQRDIGQRSMEILERQMAAERESFEDYRKSFEAERQAWARERARLERRQHD